MNKLLKSLLLSACLINVSHAAFQDETEKKHTLSVQELTEPQTQVLGFQDGIRIMRALPTELAAHIVSFLFKPMDKPLDQNKAISEVWQIIDPENTYLNPEQNEFSARKETLISDFYSGGYNYYGILHFRNKLVNNHKTMQRLIVETKSLLARLKRENPENIETESYTTLLKHDAIFDCFIGDETITAVKDFIRDPEDPLDEEKKEKLISILESKQKYYNHYCPRLKSAIDYLNAAYPELNQFVAFSKLPLAMYYDRKDDKGVIYEHEISNIDYLNMIACAYSANFKFLVIKDKKETFSRHMLHLGKLMKVSPILLSNLRFIDVLPYVDKDYSGQEWENVCTLYPNLKHITWLRNHGRINDYTGFKLYNNATFTDIEIQLPQEINKYTSKNLRENTNLERLHIKILSSKPQEVICPLLQLGPIMENSQSFTSLEISWPAQVIQDIGDTNPLMIIYNSIFNHLWKTLEKNNTVQEIKISSFFAPDNISMFWASRSLLGEFASRINRNQGSKVRKVTITFPLCDWVAKDFQDPLWSLSIIGNTYELTRADIDDFLAVIIENEDN